MRILVKSDTAASTNGIAAPTTMPMINNDELFFVFLPRPLILKEKIDGNMIDIKKVTPIIAYTDNLPSTENAIAKRKQLIMQYAINNLTGLINRIAAVP